MSEMIELMDQSRNYELQVRMLTASKDLDTDSSQLMRLET